MRPHTNIGIIGGALGGGHTTLTAAIMVAPKEDLRGLYVPIERATHVLPAPPTQTFHYYPLGGPPRMRREPDPPPPREKTAEDLARMAAAQAKRDRKATKKTTR